MYKLHGFWTDERGNKWNAAWCSEKMAIKLSESLVGSYNCVDCENCVGCNSCEASRHMIGCVECSGCVLCYWQTRLVKRHDIGELIIK